MSTEIQAKWPVIDFERLHEFAFDEDFRVRVPFYHAGYWYVGVQNTVVKPDLAAWDFWRLGRWRGRAPSRIVPTNLAVSETGLEQDELGDVAVGASGSGLMASASVLYGENFTGGNRHWMLFNAHTGGVVSGDDYVTSTADSSWALPVLSAGSYALWVRFGDIEERPVSAAKYKELTGTNLAGEYSYTEDGASYWWDWRRNLGRKPSDPEHAFYARRRELELAGTTLDNPAWAAFVQGTSANSGEWSMLRLQIGGGTWSQSAPCSPGPALYRKLESAALGEALETVEFDPAARCISAATVQRNGKLLIAGNRAGRSGPELALWCYDGEDWTLLGLNPNLSNGICECSLADHSCGSIVETRGGSIYVLSKCSLHRYVSSGATVRERLPGYPALTGGHPGGQCLQEMSGALWWVTENFGEGARNEVTNTSQFYNTLRTLAADGRIGSGNGTVCHGPNALTLHQGALTGIVQNLPFSDAEARGRIGTIQGTIWNPTGPDWLADAYLLQGVESARGHLICTGVEAHSELPLAAVLSPGGADGEGALQFARFPFRVERMTRIVKDGVEQMLILGKEVSDPAAVLDDLPYSLVLLPFHGGTPWVHFCLHWDGTKFQVDLDGIPESFALDEAPPYMSYFDGGGGPGDWLFSQTLPEEPYLQRNLTESHLEYQLVGAPPYNLSNYCKACFTGDESYIRAEACSGGPDLTEEGIRYTVVEVPLQQDWWAAQIDDVETTQPLVQALKHMPSIWLCFDSEADDLDFPAYTFPVTRINENGRFDLPRTLTPEADGRFRVLFLWPPSDDSGPAYEVSQFSIQRRE